MNSLPLETYRQAANSALIWLTNQIGDEGSLGPDNRDLACYYKLPYLMQLSGRVVETYRLLYISLIFSPTSGTGSCCAASICGGTGVSSKPSSMRSRLHQIASQHPGDRLRPCPKPKC